MRKLFWEELKLNTRYLIIGVKECDTSVKSGFLQEKVSCPTFLFKNIIHLIEPQNNEDYDDYYGLYIYGFNYVYCELSPYLQEIRDTKPKKIPSLQSLVKYQLSTEEIRIAREYDGMF
jgi:hypothetical protein